MPMDNSVHPGGLGASVITPKHKSGTQRITLGKAQACHQCRKRKVKCDADRPCSNCRRSHSKLLRANLHLGKSEPHCTYDEAASMPWDCESEPSTETLHELEERVKELEGQIKLPSRLRQIPELSRLSAKYLGRSASPDLEFRSHPRSSVISDDWPVVLPPKPLFFHLVELFFNCWPNARRAVHRPTFMSQLLEPPSSNKFPFIGLLHAICAAAAIHSPYVDVAPTPDLGVRLAEDAFEGRTRRTDDRELAFDEEHFLLAKTQSVASARIGKNIMEAAQASIIATWWAFSCGRWLDVWATSSLAIRLSSAMGLNLSDSTHKLLPYRMRHKLLIDEPNSYTDTELRRNVFWCAYALQRYQLFVSSWSFDISDEDINQTLPATLEAFEACVDDGQKRQDILSSDLFTTHSDNLDDFGLYVKCAILLSRIHVLQYRHLQKYNSIEEVRASREMQAIDSMISAMKASIVKSKFNPSDQISTSAISNLFMAHMAPYLAAVSVHEPLANWEDPSCQSANKALGAARAIIRYISALMAAPWDCARLDRTACLCWRAAARALLYSLRHAPESLAPILRAEIRLIRNAFLMGGGRVVLFLRQRQAFDVEIVQALGEQEAAKLFREENDCAV